MSWHKPPSDAAWRQVHLAYLEQMRQLVWLHCGRCGHERMAAPEQLARRHGLPMTLPLLSIARRLVCRQCGEAKGYCWPGPRHDGKRRAEELP